MRYQLLGQTQLKIKGVVHKGNRETTGEQMNEISTLK